MNNKEKILTYIARTLMGEALFPNKGLDFWNKCKQDQLEIGDIIMCNTSGIHDWTFGVLVEKGEGFFEKPWVIKEFNTERLCNISNDSFYKIPFEIPYEYFFTDKEHAVFMKCKKAIKDWYSVRFMKVSFEENSCKFEVRKPFDDKLLAEIEFKYNSKTTIKSIRNLLIDKIGEENIY